MMSPPIALFEIRWNWHAAASAQPTSVRLQDDFSLQTLSSRGQSLYSARTFDVIACNISAMALHNSEPRGSLFGFRSTAEVSGSRMGSTLLGRMVGDMLAICPSCAARAPKVVWEARSTGPRWPQSARSGPQHGPFGGEGTRTCSGMARESPGGLRQELSARCRALNTAAVDPRKSLRFRGAPRTRPTERRRVPTSPEVGERGPFERCSGSLVPTASGLAAVCAGYAARQLPIAAPAQLVATQPHMADHVPDPPMRKAARATPNNTLAGAAATYLRRRAMDCRPDSSLELEIGEPAVTEGLFEYCRDCGQPWASWLPTLAHNWPTCGEIGRRYAESAGFGCDFVEQAPPGRGQTNRAYRQLLLANSDSRWAANRAKQLPNICPGPPRRLVQRCAKIVPKLVGRPSLERHRP